MTEQKTTAPNPVDEFRAVKRRDPDDAAHDFLRAGVRAAIDALDVGNPDLAAHVLHSAWVFGWMITLGQPPR